MWNFKKMIRKNTSKILIPLLILAVLSGVFGIANKVSVADAVEGTCRYVFISYEQDGSEKGRERVVVEGETLEGCSALINLYSMEWDGPQGLGGYFREENNWWIPYSDTRPDPRKSTLDCNKEPDKSTAICRTLIANCKAPDVIEGSKCISKTPIPNTTYKLLAPLPCPPGSLSCEDGMLKTYEVGDKNQLSRYLNTALKIFIGICAVLAMIMIIIGGLEYMTSELPGNKEGGKERITQAIFGLLLALGAWTILNTINPDFLRADLNSLTETTLFIEGPEMEVSGEALQAICGKKAPVNGQTATSCAENEIVSVSFLGGTVRVNRAIVDDIRAIDNAVKNSKDPKVRAYRVTQLGSFNPRHATNSTSPSAHAFGLGLDINSSKNPYSGDITPCATDMPPGFVKIFTDRGFGWGGYWRSKKDTMHFSKLPNERKYTSGTCAGLK